MSVCVYTDTYELSEVDSKHIALSTRKERTQQLGIESFHCRLFDLVWFGFALPWFSVLNAEPRPCIH